MTRIYLWEKLVERVQKDSSLKIVYKKSHTLSKIIAKIAFWTDYEKVFTTAWPNILIPYADLKRQMDPDTLQHELVHFWDQETFFGLFKFLPARLNSFLFYLSYGFPQILFVFAILAIWNLWWLLALAFLLPLPAPFRMIAEMRAYRRSVELGVPPENISAFSGSSYYFMWPFKKQVMKLLKKESPYKEKMSKMVADIDSA